MLSDSLKTGCVTSESLLTSLIMLALSEVMFMDACWEIVSLAVTGFRTFFILFHLFAAPVPVPDPGTILERLRSGVGVLLSVSIIDSEGRLVAGPLTVKKKKSDLGYSINNSVQLTASTNRQQNAKLSN